MLPSFIPIDGHTLMDWQKEGLGWNFIGVSANYILFFVYFFHSKKPKEYFGLHIGKIKHHLVWFCVLTIVLIIFMRIMAFLTEGQLVFQIPLWSTIIFQFLFVALGEEIFWRGLIQTKFGIWIASIGFGGLHFIPDFILSILMGSDFNIMGGIASLVFATFIGFIFGWVRIKTDSIYACALLHGLYGLSNYMFVSANV